MDINEFKRQYIVTAILNEKHGIYLVTEAASGHQFVQKILTVYSPEVYRALFDHPISGIPKIHDMFEWNGVLYVIEEYICGLNLRDLLDNSDILPPARTVDITNKLCNILQKLHSFSPPIVHRDIKPSNIIIAPDDEVWLIDLNASKFENTSQSKDTVLIGTEGYAAPEQYGFGPSNPKTDIYAVGILLNEMLTGDLPSVQKAELPFCSIVDKCTRLEPSERYGSVMEISGELNKISFNKKDNSIKQQYHLKWLPPGFRSLRVWKMIIAAFGYCLLFATGLTLQVDGAGPLKLWVNRISYISIGLIMILFILNYGNIWDILGLTRIKRMWLRVIMTILAAIILFTLIMLIFALINSAFPTEAI